MQGHKRYDSILRKYIFHKSYKYCLLMCLVLCVALWRGAVVTAQNSTPAVIPYLSLKANFPVLTSSSIPGNGPEPALLNDQRRYEMPVGIFVTALYGLNFANQTYSMSGWIWALYAPEKLPEGYSFSNRIEFVNARDWSLSSTEHFITNYPNGLQWSMTKFTATLNQNWDLTHFPFDKQNLQLIVESVELDSSAINFLPDIKNSMVSHDIRLSGWHISSIQMENRDYEYPTTFGAPGDAKGVYPRIILSIPIERQGLRIFVTTFLGFFISYIIISTLVLFGKDLFSTRISLIMSSVFASVGNKYTIDYLFPPQSNFMLSDLIQVATFAIVAMALINTITVNQLEKSGKEKFAHRLDAIVSGTLTVSYPLVIFWGVYSALVAG